MKKIFLLLIFTTIIFGQSKEFKTTIDSVSYGIGYDFGQSIQKQNLGLNPEFLIAGIADAVKLKGSKIDTDVLTNIIIKFHSDRLAKLESERNKIIIANRKLADEFLKNNKKNPDVKITESGLQYLIKREGTGRKPKENGKVKVNYEGKFIDGTVFDSSYKRSKPHTFTLMNVIPGWREGLQLMKEGSEYIFFIPPELGYGETERAKIPANSLLIFRVELIEVMNN